VRTGSIIIAIVVGVVAVVVAAPLPAGFRVVTGSVSPDKTLGVIAPDADHASQAAHQNQLVQVSTGKVIATIDAETVYEHENHVDITPAWSADGSLLAWYARGKWGSAVLVLLRVDHASVRQQIDVRERAVERALANARKANPAAYEAAKQEGAGNGAWFRDGFAIDVRPVTDGPPTLPFKFVVDMTSNPKELESYPAPARFAASMIGVVGRDGAITFGQFVTK